MLTPLINNLFHIQFWVQSLYFFGIIIKFRHSQIEHFIRINNLL